MISIHAPARGATPQHFAVHSLFEISIHAPARGATRNGDRETNASGNFNPRSREGSDKNAGGHVLAELHFNPRSREGSDFYWFTIIQHMYNFNPRSREGSDALHFVLRHMIHISIHAPARGATGLFTWNANSLAFQSTLPRGERPVFLPADFAHVRFQSTLPRGERHRLTIIQHTPFRISIHAPARGATGMTRL